MRVSELIEILKDQPPDAEVELAIVAPVETAEAELVAVSTLVAEIELVAVTALVAVVTFVSVRVATPAACAHASPSGPDISTKSPTYRSSVDNVVPSRSSTTWGARVPGRPCDFRGSMSRAPSST